MHSKLLPKEIQAQLAVGEISSILPTLRARIEEGYGQYHPYYIALLCAAAETCFLKAQYPLALDLSIEAQQRALLVLEPKHPLLGIIFELKGKTLAAQKQTREAYYWLQQALEIARLEPELEVRSLEVEYAKVLLEYRRPPIARQVLEERCTRAGASLEERLVYCLAAQADGQSEQAIALLGAALPEITALGADFEKSLERHILRDALQYLALSSQEKIPQAPASQAAELLLRFELVSQEERFNFQLKQAQALFGSGNFEVARGILLELLDHKQHVERIQLEDLQDIEGMLGEIEFHAQRPEIARQHFERALRLLEQLPELADAHGRVLHNLGLIALSERDSQTAIESLRQAVELRRTLDPLSLAESLLALGMSFKAAADFENAVSFMAEAVEIRQELLSSEDELLLQAQDFLAESEELQRGANNATEKTEISTATPGAEPPSAASPKSLASAEDAVRSKDAAQIRIQTTITSSDITAAFHSAYQLQQDGDYSEALDAYKALLEVIERQHGPSHSNLIPILKEMSACFRRLGFEPQAQGLEKRWQAIGSE